MERSSDSKSSSTDHEETTDHHHHHHHHDDTAGTGRSYECVFCKRGFTTAQALGGHMNIHRKDRANKPIVRPNNSNCRSSFDHEDNYYATLRGYSSIQTYPPAVVQLNYQTFLPSSASGWDCRPPNNISDGFYVQSPQILNHVEEEEEDWRRNLSLQIGPSDGKRGQDGSEADELDLELRLGHI